MKPSRFNIRSTLADGGALHLNFWTLALLALDPPAARKAVLILDDPARHAGARGHRRLARLLAKNGFLVADDIDELAPLRAGYRAFQTAADDLSLTILPTLACNFDCTYCYEGRTHRGRMTRAVEDALPPFAAARLPRGGHMGVTWYGGEPLLAKPAIERLSRAFLALCAERGARYDARIITNGYLLDETAARWLKDLGVTGAQVTLDGPPDVHDRRRPLASGGGSFAAIVDNLQQAADVLEITIRANIDDGNRADVGELLDRLVELGLGHRVSFYAGQTTPLGSTCADGANDCLQPEAFSLVTLESSLDLTRRGLLDAVRPRAANGPCGAVRGNSFVVSPDGGLSTCWEEVGDPARYTAHLLEPQSEQMERNRRSWAAFDPFDLECRDCRVLPICMSWCPRRVRETGTLPCPGWKHHPDEHLLNEYRLRQLDQERQVAIGLAELRDALRRSRPSSPRAVRGDGASGASAGRGRR